MNLKAWRLKCESKSVKVKVYEFHNIYKIYRLHKFYYRIFWLTFKYFCTWNHSQSSNQTSERSTKKSKNWPDYQSTADSYKVESPQEKLIFRLTITLEIDLNTLTKKATVKITRFRVNFILSSKHTICIKMQSFRINCIFLTFYTSL